MFESFQGSRNIEMAYMFESFQGLLKKRNLKEGISAFSRENDMESR